MAAGAIAVLAADIVVLTYDESSTAVSFDASVEHFRRARAAPTTTAALPNPTTTTPTSSVGPRARPTSPSHQNTVTQVMRRPAEGVYAYATTGGESLSLGGAHHAYPQETYATVQHQAGCGWRAEHHIIEEHVEHVVLCTDREGIRLHEDGARISFYGQSGEETYLCEPPIVLFTPSDRPGAVRDGVCTNDRGREDHHQVLIGTENVPVGDASVPTLHIRVVVTVSGRGEGEARYDTWLDAATGLKVKENRTVDTTAHEFGASIRYTETATFRLLSMSPRT